MVLEMKLEKWEPGLDSMTVYIPYLSKHYRGGVDDQGFSPLFISKFVFFDGF